MMMKIMCIGGGDRRGGRAGLPLQHDPHLDGDDDDDVDVCWWSHRR